MIVNIDYRKNVEVATLKEASEAVTNYINGGNEDGMWLGASEWNGSGEVKDNGKVIAIVSYNGRVWTPEKNWEDRTEIKI